MEFDLASFILGGLTFIAAWFFSGFFGSAGSAAWERVTGWWSPPEPADQQVPWTFAENFDLAGVQLAWVREHSILDSEARGYTMYRNKKGARRYRDRGDWREFLMQMPEDG